MLNKIFGQDSSFRFYFIAIFPNTQETLKKQLSNPLDSSNLPPLHWRNPAKGLTVTQAFICISYIYSAQNRRYI